MKPIVRAVAVGVLAVAGWTGCTTKTGSAALDRDEAQAEASLGSRIKKRSNISPTAGAVRENMEQGRVQAGAAAVAEVQRNP